MNTNDIEAMLVQKRAANLLASKQLTLGELIVKLEAIEDKSKPIVFDGGKYHPTELDSWRGSYEELAIGYSDGLASDRPPRTKGLLVHLRSAIGSIFYGYKGGEFLMGKTTPVWVANYGQSNGFRRKGNIDTQVVVDVSQDETSVIIETENIDY